MVDVAVLVRDLIAVLAAVDALVAPVAVNEYEPPSPWPWFGPPSKSFGQSARVP